MNWREAVVGMRVRVKGSLMGLVPDEKAHLGYRECKVPKGDDAWRTGIVVQTSSKGWHETIPTEVDMPFFVHVKLDLSARTRVGYAQIVYADVRQVEDEVRA